MSKLSVFDAINKIVGNSVRIYTGPIHRIYADDFELVRGRPLCVKKDVIVKKHASFYLYDANNNIFENMDYGMVIPTHSEAIKHCDDVVLKNKTALTNALSGRVNDPREIRRILESIKNDSESLYYISSELVYSHDISKKDFKQLIKKREDFNNKNKK